MIRSDTVGQRTNIRGDCTAAQSWDSVSTGEQLQKCLLSDYVETVVSGTADAMIALTGYTFPLLFSCLFS